MPPISRGSPRGAEAAGPGRSHGAAGRQRGVADPAELRSEQAMDVGAPVRDGPVRGK